MTPNLGEIAALLTAICYATSSIFFTVAGQRFGPLVANRLRLIIAILFIATTHWIIFGTPIPLSADPQRWFWLGCSGVVGLAIGDLFLFQAYVLIGPRLGLLFLSLSPALATLLAWIFLGEALSLGNILGILITLVGIIWVVLERNPIGKGLSDPIAGIHNRDYRIGILAGLGAATGQAVGLVLAKKGLGGDFPALSGNVMRMLAAMLALWGVTIIQKQVKTTLQQVCLKRNSMLYILVGAFIGPLIGVSLSLFAIQHTNVGIASTIIALPPVFLLPIGYFIFKERFGWGAVAGTLVTIAGVAILFWF
jgi:drug/metabolite transporter (DMT)-like permease